MNQRSTDAHGGGSSFADARRSSRFRGARERNAILDYSAVCIRPRGPGRRRPPAAREGRPKSEEDSVHVTVRRERILSAALCRFAFLCRRWLLLLGIGTRAQCSAACVGKGKRLFRVAHRNARIEYVYRAKEEPLRAEASCGFRDITRQRGRVFVPACRGPARLARTPT